MSDDFTGADIASAMGGGGSEPAATSTDSSVSTPPESTAAATGTATTQPAVTTPIAPTKPPGPIPFPEHQRIIENARIKGAEEYKAKYGWAETADKTTYDQAVALARQFSTDKIGYIRNLIAEMQADPDLGPKLRSEAARALASGRAAPAMPDPDVTITDDQGNPVGRTYSAEQLAKRDAWLKDQFLAEVRQEIAPLVQTHKTLETERQHAKDEADGQKFASTLYSELKDYPHFEANKKAIGAKVVTLLQQYGDDPRTNDPAFLEAVTLRAYHHVVTRQQDTLSRQAAVHDINTKASGSGVTPGRTPVGAPKRSEDGRFTADDIAAEFARRRIG